MSKLCQVEVNIAVGGVNSVGGGVNNAEGGVNIAEGGVIIAKVVANHKSRSKEK